VGIAKAEASEVDAPYVADCPVVLECRLFKDVEVEGAHIGVIIGEVVAAHISVEARERWQNGFLDVSPFRPVGRLWAGYYAWVDEIFRLDRPVVDRATGEMIEPPKS
jgi:flavin reductase (DIM6/NTAB) family NADH-FMN oxidoreductase RutF